MAIFVEDNFVQNIACIAFLTLNLCSTHSNYPVYKLSKGKVVA